jgi:hypothetical protein
VTVSTSDFNISGKRLSNTYEKIATEDGKTGIVADDIFLTTIVLKNEQSGNIAMFAWNKMIYDPNSTDRIHLYQPLVSEVKKYPILSGWVIMLRETS